MRVVMQALSSWRITCLSKVLRHPILIELAQFQLSLGNKDKIYIPSRMQPYYGRAEEEQGGKRGGSRYHEGLLSSRALAFHEVVLLAYLVDCIYRNSLGILFSLENNGLLFLTRSSSRERSFARLDAFLQSCSLDFIGIRIPLVLACPIISCRLVKLDTVDTSTLSLTKINLYNNLSGVSSPIRGVPAIAIAIARV